LLLLNSLELLRLEQGEPQVDQEAARQERCQEMHSSHVNLQHRKPRQTEVWGSLRKEGVKIGLLAVKIL